MVVEEVVLPNAEKNIKVCFEHVLAEGNTNAASSNCGQHASLKLIFGICEAEGCLVDHDKGVGDCVVAKAHDVGGKRDVDPVLQVGRLVGHSDAHIVFLKVQKITVVILFSDLLDQRTVGEAVPAFVGGRKSGIESRDGRCELQLADGHMSANEGIPGEDEQIGEGEVGEVGRLEVAKDGGGEVCVGVIGCVELIVYEVIETVAGVAWVEGLGVDFGCCVVDICDCVDGVREGGGEVPRAFVESSDQSVCEGLAA